MIVRCKTIDTIKTHGEVYDGCRFHFLIKLTRVGCPLSLPIWAMRIMGRTTSKHLKSQILGIQPMESKWNPVNSYGFGMCFQVYHRKQS